MSSWRIHPHCSDAICRSYSPWHKFKLENALPDKICNHYVKNLFVGPPMDWTLAAETKSVEPIGSYLNSGVFFVVFLPFPFQELLKHYSFGFIPEMGDLGRCSLTHSLLFPIQFFTVSLSAINLTHARGRNNSSRRKKLVISSKKLEPVSEENTL